MEILIIGVITGVICAAVAPSRGRNALAWFLIGFLLGLIGVILVFVLPNLKEQQRHREHAAEERRRLREQLQQERIKNETFRQYAGDRFDAHDKALGMDTRPAGALAGGAAPAPTLPASAPSGAPWFYEQGGSRKGPVPASRVRDLLRAGTLGPNTLVWQEGQPDWLPLSHVPELLRGDRA